MNNPLLKTKARYVWWLLSALFGGAVAIFFIGSPLLETPVPLVQKVIEPLSDALKGVALSGRLKDSITAVSTSVLLAMPQAVIAGVLLGMLAYKVPYPRTLLYSVAFWPLAILTGVYWSAAHSLEETKTWTLLSGLGVAVQREFMETAMSFIILSIIFYICALPSYLAIKKFSARSKRESAAESAERDHRQPAQ